MINHEHSIAKAPTFPIVEFVEIQFSLLDPSEMYSVLTDLAVGQGINPADVLYIGIDLDDELPHIRGFGDRRETWAFTDEETREGVRRSYGSDHDSKSPFYYAFSGTAAPAIVLADAKKFLQLGHTKDEYYTRSNLEYRLLDDFTFDDAVIGIVRTTV